MFVKDFSKIAHLLCTLLKKESKFVVDDVCLRAFEELKKKLVSAPVIISLNWRQPFEGMCDESGVGLGFVLG